MNPLKVIVTGDFSAGKTQFIKTLTQNSFSTEKSITLEGELDIKKTTTVALDYGKITLDGKTVHLFGTPGQERFKFMWEILDKNKSAFILLVDSTDLNNINNGKSFIDFFYSEDIPFIIGCNKQDKENALPVGEIKNILEIEADYLPLVAKDRESSLEVLKHLINKSQHILV